MRIRVDRLLVEKGLVSSRRQAQELIEAGCVSMQTSTGRRPVRKASEQIEVGPELDPQFEVRPTQEFRYVSRGGLKMEGALRHAGIDVNGLLVLDVGISTGGFTDCLLQAGAGRVVGLDVGHGQLDEKIKLDPRVVHFEGVNARDLSSVPIQEHTAGQKFDLIVVDVSFISLQLVLPEAIKYLKETSGKETSGMILALVKPQFEVGRDGLSKGGIVKNPEKFTEVRLKILNLCEHLNLKVEDYFASPIEGADGNKEFFVLARGL